MTEEMNNVEVEDKEMDNGVETQGLQDGYLLINCKFNYGGRTKNYGFINLIIDIKSKSLIKASALLTSDRDIWDINLHISFFKDELDEFMERTATTEDNDLRLEIKDNLDVTGLVEANNNEEIERIVQETIENIIQEAVSLNLIIERINQEELRVIYPQLLNKKEGVADKEATSNNDKDALDGATNNGKLNIDIKLNCTPIISPVKGRKITELNLGDELIVKVNDDREISKSIVSMLEKNEDGDLIGMIYEINYNKELDRYNVLVQFKSNIFGNLVIDPELKVKFNKTIIENESNQREGLKEIDQNILIIGIFAAIMIILILGVVIFFT
ncbi:hypothetical protein BX659_10470 [Orenia metallireducens]|jgi:hypothetical protein|uniref:DUF4899 domain-containing protein n=1 Tax=Orenia metallireducens TaxID=1413210 RepID=A0A285GC11_9FIRM|nr:hypothetical protein [Orenia metallireducens]PRX32521.1 hypothetical protein BX659_10470 [Orenia metallireducens]SNY20995.1 hypothetical protein SAMN06265827_10678 [Orenia metallireducens]